MKKRERRDWIKFLLIISIAVVVFALGVFIALIIRNDYLINSELKTRARAHIHLILETRKWNARYGGVYVEKKEGMESNPYLEDPDIKTCDGKVYTLKNPALMTHEISELSREDSLLTFHMTSLKPINPKNLPDNFEENALRSFEKGAAEIFAKEKDNELTSFRYMVPLFVEQSCLQCHAKQGYRTGELRGGISVKFDITSIEDAQRFNNYMISAIGIISALVLLGTIFSMTILLKRKIDRTQKEIEKLAVTDPLTGLYNRRFFFEKMNEEIKRSKRFRHALGCILFDIDRFKGINDKYGHQAGDMVLRNIANTAKDCCRQTDFIARYGGEEFVILLPGAGAEGTYTLAEKVRTAVENLKIIHEKDIEIPVTISLGAAGFTADDLDNISDNDIIISSADKALYRAKDNGRNRTEGA